MADKILTEAYDKLKAIEESEDPFCIGAKEDSVVEAFTEVTEADFDDGKSADWQPQDDDEWEDDDEPESQSARVDSFTVESDSGDTYMIDFQNEGGVSRAFIDINGITVATYTDTQSGAKQPQIKDDGQILDALAALIMEFGSQ